MPSRSNTKNKPKKTRAVPASGWNITRIIGSPIINNNLVTKEIFFISAWIELKVEATSREVVTLANSEGCKLKSPMKYQEVAPEIFWPKKNSPSKLNIDRM